MPAPKPPIIKASVCVIAWWAPEFWSTACPCLAWWFMNQHYGPVWILGVPWAVNELYWWHVSLFLNYTFLICSMFSHFPSTALQLLLIAGFHPTTIYLVLKDAVVVWKAISILLGHKYLLTLSLTEIISDFGILCLYLPNFSLCCSCCSHPASYILFFPFLTRLFDFRQSFIRFQRDFSSA